MKDAEARARVESLEREADRMRQEVKELRRNINQVNDLMQQSHTAVTDRANNLQEFFDALVELLGVHFAPRHPVPAGYTACYKDPRGEPKK